MPITPVANNSIGDMDRSTLLWTWVLTTATPDGLGIEMPEWADRTWTAFETGDVAGGATTIRVQGSNNNVDWFNCINAATTVAIDLFAAGVGSIATPVENPRFMRPLLSNVGAGASITVRACLRRINTMRT